MRLFGTQRLETDRLVLRRVSLDDAEPMFRNWAPDPEVTKYLTWSPYRDVSGVESFIREQMELWQRDDHYNWFIELKNIGEVIGSIGFVRYYEDIDSLELGYAIGRAWWGQGIVPEALNAVIDFGFDVLGVNRIAAQHDVQNPNSGKVMRKCGMTYEGTLRQAGKNNRGIIDICQYSILKGEHVRTSRG